MRLAWTGAAVTAAALLTLVASEAAAQDQERCALFCTPTLLLEPTWTVERPTDGPRVIDVEGKRAWLRREGVFELVLAVDVPTRWRRISLTAESIFSPASTDNVVELGFELNLNLLHDEQTGGWMSSHAP